MENLDAITRRSMRRVRIGKRLMSIGDNVKFLHCGIQYIGTIDEIYLSRDIFEPHPDINGVVRVIIAVKENGITKYYNRRQVEIEEVN